MTETKSPPDPHVHSGSPVGRKVIQVVIALVVVVVLYLIGAAVLPNWWAHRIGNVVDQSFTMGVLFGLFVGFIFTIAPLLVLWFAFGRYRSGSRRGKSKSWKWWLGWVLLAIVLAAPNLMTLFVQIGGGSSAQNGRRTFGVDAPGFPLWTLIGVILAALAVGGLGYLARSRDSARTENRQLRGERETRSVPTPEPPTDQV